MLTDGDGDLTSTVPPDLALEIRLVGLVAVYRWRKSCAWCHVEALCRADPYRCALIAAEWAAFPEAERHRDDA